LPATLILQGLAALLLLGSGAAALGASRHPGGFPARYRLTWRIAGLALLLIGASSTLQNVHGALAIAHGEGSPMWNGYMRWAPAWNHSRQLLPFALALLLLGFALAPARRALERRWLPAVVLLAACALGAAMGWMEGALDFAPHFERVALLDAAALLFVICALAATMIADVVDRLLMLALLAYVIPLPLNALWFAWMAAHVDGGGWAPSPLSMQLYRIAFDALCAGLSAWRWRLARRGAYVPGFLPAPAEVRPMIG
jgi:hypothetical protein